MWSPSQLSHLAPPLSIRFSERQIKQRTSAASKKGRKSPDRMHKDLTRYKWIENTSPSTVHPLKGGRQPLNSMLEAYLPGFVLSGM